MTANLILLIFAMAAVINIATQHQCFTCESIDPSTCQTSGTLGNCDANGCVTVTVTPYEESEKNEACVGCPEGTTYATSPYYYKGCFDNEHFFYKIAKKAGVGHTRIRYCFQDICNAPNDRTARSQNVPLPIQIHFNGGQVEVTLIDPLNLLNGTIPSGIA